MTRLINDKAVPMYAIVFNAIASNAVTYAKGNTCMCTHVVIT